MGTWGGYLKLSQKRDLKQQIINKQCINKNTVDTRQEQRGEAT